MDFANKGGKFDLQWSSRGSWIKILLVGDKNKLAGYIKFFTEKTRPYLKGSKQRKLPRLL